MQEAAVRFGQPNTRRLVRAAQCSAMAVIEASVRLRHSLTSRLVRAGQCSAQVMTRSSVWCSAIPPLLCFLVMLGRSGQRR